ncbi:MAG: hypothetical protein ABR975_00525 [Vulcanimicrobiaceae bacterium]|jgi:hypothetical protein
MFTGIIRSARSNIGKIVVTAGAAATIGLGAMAPAPASADTTSTVLTAAAIVGGIALLSGANQAPPCAYYGDCPVYGPVYGPAYGGPVYAPAWGGGRRGGYVDRGSYGGGRGFAGRGDGGHRR